MYTIHKFDDKYRENGTLRISRLRMHISAQPKIGSLHVHTKYYYLYDNKRGNFEQEDKWNRKKTDGREVTIAVRALAHAEMSCDCRQFIALKLKSRFAS